MIRVTKANRCTQCDHDTWCLVAEDGSACICMRVQSDHPHTFTGGEVGYIHRLVDNPQPRRFVPKREEPKVVINAEAMMKEWAAKSKPEWMWQLAESLGVKGSALMELRVTWAAEHKAFAWPMRNGAGEMVGIRLRNNAGDKWAVKGSKAGIFLPYCLPQSQVWICEGPTDTAAALSMGLFAIGRPSCSGGMPDIITALRRLNVREAIIIADNDDPGINGAEMLSRHLDIPCCVVTLPCKDIRQGYNNGLTADMMDQFTKQVLWTNPEHKEQNAR